MTRARPIKLLILFADTGRGHQSIAAAIGQEFLAEVPDARVGIIDLFAELDTPVLRHANRIYSALAHHGLPVFNAMWRASNNRVVSHMMARMIFRLGRKRLVRILREQDPDVILSVHPLYMAEVVALARASMAADFPVATFVADPVTVHASWASSCDVTFVSTEEAADAIVGLGVRRDQVMLVPFPIRQGFRDAAVADRRELRRECGLRDQPTVLVTGGGLGSGRILQCVAALANSGVDVVVLPGANRRLAGQVEKYPAVRKCIGLSDDIYKICAAVDVVVGKAGPSTVFECAAIGVPMVLTDEVGCQERGNIRLAEQLRIGVHCRDLRDLAKHVRASANLRPLHSRTQAPPTIGRRLYELVQRVRPDVVSGPR